MTMSGGHKPRGSSTICLPWQQEPYERDIASHTDFRLALDQSFRDMPELFPDGFELGYTLKDSRISRKRGFRLRRIRLKATGEVFTIRPSFLMPYMVGLTDDVQAALFLRAFGVPFWALARVFGRNPMYWYRIEVGLGRNSIVGTTLRQADLPEHLLADEHHQTRDGQKNYIATVVGDGCCLGAALAPTAGSEDLLEAYGTFRKEAENVRQDYQPETVSVDGWASTRQALQTLFPLAVLLRCFLHGWLNIRSRGKLSESFAELSKKVWEAFHAPDRRSFAQRMRRLWEWSRTQNLSEWLLDQVKKLCSRSKEYGQAYAHPGGHRTSNMLDRVMRGMCGYFDGCQHLHGSKEACELHVRSWALLQNFRPWSPATQRSNEGWGSPAERLNGHRYHENWLHNLFVSASLAGFRRKINAPQNP